MRRRCEGTHNKIDSWPVWSDGVTPLLATTLLALCNRCGEETFQPLGPCHWVDSVLARRCESKRWRSKGDSCSVSVHAGHDSVSLEWIRSQAAVRRSDRAKTDPSMNKTEREVDMTACEHAFSEAKQFSMRQVLALITLTVLPALSVWADGRIQEVPVISSYPVYKTKFFYTYLIFIIQFNHK